MCEDQGYRGLNDSLADVGQLIYKLRYSDYYWTCSSETPRILFSFICKVFDPLTPMPAVPSLDKQWPLFLFWFHHLWPKLASSVPKFCRGGRSFQWYPDQSDQLSRAWNMAENAQRFEGKTQSKISCDYTWLLHGENCLSR